MIFVKELNESLHTLLETDERVVVLGEDIHDPYGGAFKATRGLTTSYPDRVLTTPVSEAGIVGVAAGLALSGYRPIVEIMFGDFMTLTFDQVVNHIAKYGAMYDGKVTCPVIIRTPSGGHRGYGPTHSQSLEKHFLGVPHLTVAAASPFHGPGEILTALLQRDEPALFVEHKLLYPEHVVRPEGSRVGDAIGREEASDGYLPSVVLSQVPREDCTVTVLAYGYSALLAARVVEQLAVEEEVFAELVVPSQISPMDWEPVEASVERTGSLVTVEEGTADWSWGTEAAAEIGRRRFSELRRPVRVVASEPTVIPSSRDKEQQVLVGADTMKEAIREAAA
jgi:acetoin:2,6-dichlorophenolindophenol oxidoreductase subunit beta